MKYVFVCADISFLTLQYMDFDLLDNTILVKTTGINRKVFKALNIIGLYRFKFLDCFSDLYFKKHFRKLLNNNDSYCFIIYSRSYEDYRCSLTRYLRREFPNCRIVVYYGDLVSKHRVNISDVLNDTDLVCSFDSDDAKNNNISWVLEPFSESVVDLKELSQDKNPIRWDVTFVGQAKNRLKQIIEIYDLLRINGLKCDFHITGVKKKDRVYTESISYEPLSFMDLLRHVVSSRCILEVMQENGVSPTTRYTEAMLFDKNLLTNCKSFLLQTNCPANVFYYNEANELSDNVFNDIIQCHNYDKREYLDKFSINTFLRTIEKLLNE